MNVVNDIVRVNDLAYHLSHVGQGETLVLLHGFTGSGEDWTVLVDSLKHRFSILTIDLPGHGHTESPGDPQRYRMEVVAEDLLAILDDLKLSYINLMGYSMGGRLALYFALQYPGRIKSLILESASPGLLRPDERQARRQRDASLADRIEHDGIPVFVDSWEKIPLFASQRRNLSAAAWEKQRSQRLKNNPTGLANSLRGMGTGSQPQFWSRLEELDLPTLLLTGELDRKFTVIAGQMAAKLSYYQMSVLANAGHNILIETPHPVCDRVVAFVTGV